MPHFVQWIAVCDVALPGWLPDIYFLFYLFIFIYFCFVLFFVWSIILFTMELQRLKLWQYEDTFVIPQIFSSWWWSSWYMWLQSLLTYYNCLCVKWQDFGYHPGSLFTYNYNHTWQQHTKLAYYNLCDPSLILLSSTPFSLWTPQSHSLSHLLWTISQNIHNNKLNLCITWRWDNMWQRPAPYIIHGIACQYGFKTYLLVTSSQRQRVFAI